MSIDPKSLQQNQLLGLAAAQETSDKVLPCSGTKGQKFYWLMVIAILCLGAFLRIETLFSRPLWYDEVFTYDVIKVANSLYDIWLASGRDGGEHPLLYYALAFISYKLHPSEMIIRVPAAFFGCLSILLINLLGNQLYGRRAGLIAGLLLATSVYHVEYSQDARPYSLLVFTLLLCHVSLIAYFRSGEKWKLLVFMLAATASLYTHHTAFLYHGALTISVFSLFLRGVFCRNVKPQFSCNETISLKRFAMSLFCAYASVFICYLPQIHHLSGYLGGANLDQTHVLQLNLKFLLELSSRWGSGRSVGALYAICLSIGLVITLMRKDAALSLLPWFAVPFLLFALLPFNKFFDIRFVIISLPAYFLLIAGGVHHVCEILEKYSTKVASQAILAIFTSCFLYFPLKSYLTFRVLPDRCSNFFYRAELMTQNSGYCEEYLILNSLYAGHDFLLRDIKR